MRKKKFEKRLVLKKGTVACLDNGDLRGVRGGELLTRECMSGDPICDSVIVICWPPTNGGC